MPSKIELPTCPTRTTAAGVLQGKCWRCGKWVTLTHKTKTRPQGARFHDHNDGINRNAWGEFKTCWGDPYYQPRDYRSF